MERSKALKIRDKAKRKYDKARAKGTGFDLDGYINVGNDKEYISFATNFPFNKITADEFAFYFDLMLAENDLMFSDEG